MVQTNEDWWKAAKLLEYVDSQEEFSQYSDKLDKYLSMKSFNIWDPTRAPLQWLRLKMYSFLAGWHFQIPSNYKVFNPGLEIKFACEEAEKLGAKTYFLGAESCQNTWLRLYHAKDMNVLHYLKQRVTFLGKVSWDCERKEAIHRMQNSEPSQFSERCVDPYLLNWFIQSSDVFFPAIKRAAID